MSWLLDTNVCIRYLNGRSPQLREKLDRANARDFRTCSVVKAELYFGAALSRDPAKALANQRLFLLPFLSLPFDDLAAEAYAAIRADLTRQGRLIGPNDLLIAAICRANNVVLVTHNTSEFERVDGLAIEDWEA